jgi:hypothetical protein
MSLKQDKNNLKQYFRSGSRPTQKQFYELIDNCYNEEFTSFVSGYHLMVDKGEGDTIKYFKREAGKTRIVPQFKHINTVHQRFYHFAIPVSHLGPGFMLEKIILEMDLPQNTKYSVKDHKKKVEITQRVQLDYIKVFNGTQEIYEYTPDEDENEPVQEILIEKTASLWRGIAIDIAIGYDIKSNIAVSDQFDLTAGNEDVLEHLFGGAGCIFKPNE